MRWLTPFLVLAVLCASSEAHALDGERRAQLGAGAAYGGKASALVFAGGAYGLADSVDLRADLLGTVRPTNGDATLALHMGGLWKWEVTQWVPYVGVGLGGRHDFAVRRWDLLLVPAAGLDYLLNRETSFVIEYRPTFTLSHERTLEHQALLGFELRWGW